jgi:hypothetical protein
MLGQILDGGLGGQVIAILVVVQGHIQNQISRLDIESQQGREHGYQPTIFQFFALHHTADRKIRWLKR